MPERPIVMSAESVRALLEGRKTQTRRVVKPVPEGFHVDHCHWSKTGFALWYDDGGCSCRPVKCPYPVGTRLWVKETYTYYLGFGEDVGVDAPVIYKADGPDECGQFPVILNGERVRVNDREPWRSPLFMPRWASRITLEVTDVRVQRLQDISIGDALAEGVRCPDCGYTSLDAGFHMDHGICVNKWLMESKVKDVGDHVAVQAFREHWDAINGKKHPWSQNVWVWAFTFRRTDA